MSWISLVLLAACSSSPGGTSFSRDNIVRTCVLEVSCLGANAPLRPVSSCVTNFEEGIASGSGIFFGPSAAVLRHIVTCGASATDCTSALTCASYNHGPSYCTTHPGTTCDGTTRVICDAVSNWGFESENCADYGLTCQSGTDTNGPYSVCTDGRSCDPTDTTITCNGNRASGCGEQGLGLTVDCSLILAGATCGSHVDSTGMTVQGCIPPGPACTSTMSHCDGNDVVSCGSGHELRLDCAAALEGHCVADATSAHCLSDATACDDGAPDACMGDALQSCVNGHLVLTPCTSAGLRTCTGTADGAICGP